MALAPAPTPVPAQGTVTGFGRYERVAGNPALGHRQLYEWDLFLSPPAGAAGAGFEGVSRRLGAPPGEVPSGDGFYRIDGVPAGVYSIYVNQPDFFASPKVVAEVVVSDGVELRLDVELDVDFSTAFAESEQWTPWDGSAYQTFTARGTAVRGISWRHAGRYDNKGAEITVLADNGDPDPRQWTEVGSTTDPSVQGDNDEWVRFGPGEIPLMPGRRYAVRVAVDGGMALYKRDKDAASYAGGQAYDGGGNPRSWDLNLTVFVDRDGTSVTHTRRRSGPGVFDGGRFAPAWGQTFVATGEGLAAVDLFAAGEAGFAVTWGVREGGPGGALVGGGEKTVASAFFASSTALAGASFNPGEIPLEPGRTYFIEARASPGLTPYAMEPADAFGDGQAYRGDVAQPGVDLSMTIVQYVSPGGPLIYTSANERPLAGRLERDIDHRSGTLSPGGAGPVGELEVAGDYTAGGEAVLTFDFGGTLEGADRLVVDGEAALGGILVLAPSENFVPVAGTRTVLLAAGSISGSFDQVVGENAGPGLAFEVDYAPGEVGVTVVAGSPPGIDAFEANPGTVTPGGTATLSWSVAGAERLRIEPGVGELTGADLTSGSIEVAPVHRRVEAFVPRGVYWSYLDDGSPRGTEWFGDAFNDAAWPRGRGKFGYGEDDEETVLDFGGDPADKRVTVYFRHRFEVADPAAISGLTARLLRDDGAAVYLNGEEVIRSNLPDGRLDGDTFAASTIGGADETEIHAFAFDPGLLRAGENLLAAEVHQRSPTSGDLAFWFELAGAEAGGGETVLVAGDATWSYLDDGTVFTTPYWVPGLDESDWEGGAAELGYGDGDEATEIGFGGDPDDKFITSFFRHAFIVSGQEAASVTDPWIDLVRDDGAAVFLNGREILRDNLPVSQLIPLSRDTEANDTVGGEDESAVHRTALDPSLFRAGCNVVAAEVHQAAPDSSDLSFDLALGAETGFQTRYPIEAGSVWRYLDDGSDRGAGALPTPFFSPAFDASGWASGPAVLGYGEGGEETLLSFGDDPDAKPITTYFRRTFDLPGPELDAATGAFVEFRRDDGAAVYLNGTELFRSNLPAGPLGFETPATVPTDDDGDRFHRFDFDPAMLQPGENLIAVEVHQSGATSSDLTFDLRLGLRLPAALNPYTLTAENRFGTVSQTLYLTVATGPGGVAYEAWARLHFDPAAPGFEVRSAPGADPDGDGADNFAEFLAGTAPDNRTSRFALLGVGREPGGNPLGLIALTWSSVPGRSYRVEASPDLVNWTTYIESRVATGPESNALFGFPPGASGQFFRVVVEPAP